MSEIKTFDFEGEETLKSISKADKFNYWMYSQIKPYSKGKILEIGSGIGNISKFFIKDNSDITLSDLRDQYLNFLKDSYPKTPQCKIDIVDKDFDSKYKQHFNSYDLVYALNVVEHVKEDSQALENLNKLLTPTGKLFILVPAYQGLFNSFDIALEHFKRYTKTSLKKIFPNSMEIKKSWYFNFMGIFGWFLVGSILKKKIIPESNMKLYNTLTPLFKLIDILVLRKIGLSVIAVAEKKQ